VPQDQQGRQARPDLRVQASRVLQVQPGRSATREKPAPQARLGLPGLLGLLVRKGMLEIQVLRVQKERREQLEPRALTVLRGRRGLQDQLAQLESPARRGLRGMLGKRVQLDHRAVLEKPGLPVLPGPRDLPGSKGRQG